MKKLTKGFKKKKTVQAKKEKERIASGDYTINNLSDQCWESNPALPHACLAKLPPLRATVLCCGAVWNLWEVSWGRVTLLSVVSVWQCPLTNIWKSFCVCVCVCVLSNFSVVCDVYSFPRTAVKIYKLGGWKQQKTIAMYSAIKLWRPEIWN